MKISIFLLGVASIAFCQIDTVARLSFFPMHIGDIWQYEVKESYMGDTISTKYEVEEIVGDTLMPNGKRYFVFQHNVPYGYFYYQRIDTSSMIVYRYDEYDYCGGYEMDLFDLSIVDSVGWDNCETESGHYYISTTTVEDSVGKTGYRAIQTIYKGNSYDFNQTLSSGFGYSYGVFGDLGYHDNFSLIAANIDGVEYGDFVGVDDDPYLPHQIFLHQNHPNPFNLTTTIEFSIPEAGLVTLTVYDLMGREVEVILKKEVNAGFHTVRWNADEVSSGIYFYQLNTSNSIKAGHKLVNKMTIIK